MLVVLVFFFFSHFADNQILSFPCTTYFYYMVVHFKFNILLWERVEEFVWGAHWGREVPSFQAYEIC